MTSSGFDNVIIDVGDREEAKSAVENGRNFRLMPACIGDEYDQYLPAWFTKLPPDVRMRLCFPPGGSGGDSPASPALNKGSSTVQLRRGDAASAALAAASGGGPKQSTSSAGTTKIVKLVPCDPPKFLKSAAVPFSRTITTTAPAETTLLTPGVFASANQSMSSSAVVVASPVANTSSPVFVSQDELLDLMDDFEGRNKQNILDPNQPVYDQ